MFKIAIIMSICAMNPSTVPPGTDPQCSPFFQHVFKMESMEFCMNVVGPKGIEMFQSYATARKPYLAYNCVNTEKEFAI